uniref:Uncharacterized protein n=1 Tax=Neogobius melanostomus TaxID=47308 RepID=A0A8C6UDF8_9GOBI
HFLFEHMVKTGNLSWLSSTVNIYNINTSKRLKTALAHGVGHGGSGRVDHGHEPHEAHVVYLEVHIVCVKRKAFGILLLRHEQVAETWIIGK